MFNFVQDFDNCMLTPCSSFDLTDVEQQKKCFHYTNLQPLWATTKEIDGVVHLGNLNKGAKY